MPRGIRRSDEELAAAGPLASRLVSLMRERGMSAREVSLKAGLGADAVRGILRGRSRHPRSLDAIAGALGVPVFALTGDDAGAPVTGMLDLPEVDATSWVSGSLADLTARRVWRVPADAVAVPASARLVVVRLPEGATVVDASAREPGAIPAPWILHDGYRCGIALLSVRGDLIRMERDGEATEIPRMAHGILGRVVTIWRAS